VCAGQALVEGFQDVDMTRVVWPLIRDWGLLVFWGSGGIMDPRSRATIPGRMGFVGDFGIVVGVAGHELPCDTPAPGASE